eukprot:4566880-Pyramimonas_sp.AAC.1
MQQDALEPRGHATSPEGFEHLGSGPRENSSGVLQGLGRGPEDTLTPCPAARWRIGRETERD